MNHTFTLLRYRENGADYCRNCLMDSTPSAFAFSVHDDPQAVAAEWAARLLEEERTSTRAHCSVEYTLLIDGRDRDNDPQDNPEAGEEALRYLGFDIERLRDDIDALVAAELKRLREEQLQKDEAAKRVQEQAALQRQRAAARQREAEDLATLARLQARYGRR